SSEASRPDSARSRPRSRASSAWLAPTSTSITPKSRNAANERPITGSDQARGGASNHQAHPAAEPPRSEASPSGVPEPGSDHAQLEARGLGHALRGPRRLPDQ